ncbi:hypothetical protein [Haloferax sp. YSSS75]|uniref:hypothetical protein n=1 Tax=Haloferax sp. YSSS75 TaxID=3388564 RepID=UPI00398C9180
MNRPPHRRRTAGTLADDGTELCRAAGVDTPVVADDELYVARGGETAVLTRDDGSETATFGGTPHARAGQILVTSVRGWARTYDIQENMELWEYRTPEVKVEDQLLRGVSGMVPLGGAVYVVAAEGFHELGAAEN